LFFDRYLSYSYTHCSARSFWAIYLGTMAKSRGKLGPYSRRLQRGVIGGLREIDGRSAEGRFARHLEAELTAHVGGNPTIVQKPPTLAEVLAQGKAEREGAAA
jgi:hypothetical protein